MATWYTSDLHLGHATIIGDCSRPHRDNTAMEEAILGALVDCVAPDDDLWIIGDFAVGDDGEMDRIARWFEHIPGNKHLVLGDHDDGAHGALLGHRCKRWRKSGTAINAPCCSTTP